MLLPKSLKELKQNPPQSIAAAPLSSGRALLDEFLDGGLRWGELSEWGMPWGQAQREMILGFLAQAQQTPSWILWIYGQKDIAINPLAWHARGLDLNWLRFAYAQQPVQELKPVFLSDLFRIIVIDGVQRLSEEDCAFLSRQARRYKQVILILRSQPLSENRGNVWARTRVNCWQDLEQQRLCAKILKGRLPRQIVWASHSL